MKGCELEYYEPDSKAAIKSLMELIKSAVGFAGTR